MRKTIEEITETLFIMASQDVRLETANKVLGDWVAKERKIAVEKSLIEAKKLAIAEDSSYYESNSNIDFMALAPKIIEQLNKGEI